MKEYKRSICSTCYHLTYCSLTTDKTSVSSCSEYAHLLEGDESPVIMVSTEMTSGMNTSRNKNTLN